MKHIPVPWVRGPFQTISIDWEVDGVSGSTQCEAWRGQYEIECLERAGYTVLTVEDIPEE